MNSCRIWQITCLWRVCGYRAPEAASSRGRDIAMELGSGAT
jgi:hypothetical protein